MPGAIPTVEASSAAERAVIGACMLDAATAVRQCAELVTEADFADPRLGALYQILTTLHNAGTPVDPVTMLQVATQEGLRGVDGPYLYDLLAATPTASNAGYYANQVREGGVRRRLWAFGRRAQQLAEEGRDLAETMTAVRADYGVIESAAAGTLDARPLGDVLDGPDDYDWLIPQLLERQDRLILTGGEGAGKSTYVRQIAICAAAGIHPTTFRSMAPIRVLVVDAENTEKQWRRATRPLAVKARLAGSVDPARTLQLACTSRLDLTNDRDLGAVHRLVDKHQPDLLMIGPLYRLIPRAITNDDDAAPLLTALDSLRARGLALVMEAHAGHAIGPGGERDLRPRGSSALMGWPEFGFGLAVDRSAIVPGAAPSVFKLVRWRGDRDQREWPDTLLRGGAWPWTDDRHNASGAGPAWHPGIAS